MTARCYREFCLAEPTVEVRDFGREPKGPFVSEWRGVWGWCASHAPARG